MGDKGDIRLMSDKLKRLTKANEVLLTALNFYSNPDKYQGSSFWGIVVDEGGIARKAIRESEEIK